MIVAFSFTLRRTTGSHRHYARSDVPYVINIQPRGKEAKTYQIEQFLAICSEHGLTLEE